MKYIIYDNGLFEVPYIFPFEIKHVDFAVNMQISLERIVAAGSIRHSKKGMQCWGTSIGLGKKSRNEVDEDLINRMLVTNY